MNCLEVRAQACNPVNLKKTLRFSWRFCIFNKPSANHFLAIAATLQSDFPAFAEKKF